MTSKPESMEALKIMGDYLRAFMALNLLSTQDQAAILAKFSESLSSGPAIPSDPAIVQAELQSPAV